MFRPLYPSKRHTHTFAKELLGLERAKLKLLRHRRELRVYASVRACKRACFFTFLFFFNVFVSVFLRFSLCFSFSFFAVFLLDCGRVCMCKDLLHVFPLSLSLFLTLHRPVFLTRSLFLSLSLFLCQCLLISSCRDLIN